MTAVLVPCEQDNDLDDDPPESSELADLRSMVLIFDDLYEDCMRGPVSQEDLDELNHLYGYLLRREQQHWIGCTYDYFYKICDAASDYFPMIRYTLDLLPAD